MCLWFVDCLFTAFSCTSLSLCLRSVLQALHGCCERAVRGAVIPGCGLEWAQHYRENVESDWHCLNEWAAMTGLESVRRDTGARSSSNRESVEKEIKAQLRDIMRTEDLENITSKQVKWKRVCHYSAFQAMSHNVTKLFPLLTYRPLFMV